jgi:hypothetical protein
VSGLDQERVDRRKGDGRGTPSTSGSTKEIKKVLHEPCAALTSSQGAGPPSMVSGKHKCEGTRVHTPLHGLPLPGRRSRRGEWKSPRQQREGSRLEHVTQRRDVAVGIKVCGRGKQDGEQGKGNKSTTKMSNLTIESEKENKKAHQTITGRLLDSPHRVCKLPMRRLCRFGRHSQGSEGRGGPTQEPLQANRLRKSFEQAT